MAKKRYSDGGVLSTEGAKKAGEDAGKAARTTSFGKFLDRKIGEADKLTARMNLLHSKGREALNQADRDAFALEDAAKAERSKFTDSMGSYKKGGKVKSASSRADGIAQRGKTRGKVY